MKSFIIILMIFICSSASAKEFETKDNFTLLIPDNWLEIPPYVLREAEAYALKISNGKTVLKYDYGFQLSSAFNWLEYPYIFVQINRDRRIAPREMKDQLQLQDDFNKGIEHVKKNSAETLSNIAKDEFRYDESSNTLWSSYSMHVTNIGQIKGVTGMKLTQFGFIQVNGYAKEEEFEKYAPVFRSLVNDMLIDEEYKYSPKFTDNIPTIFGVDLTKIAVGAVLGAIFTLIARFLQKPKKTETSEDLS